jgi:hypothetical protein
LLAESPNTVDSCSRHGVVAAGLTSERPGSVIPVSKTFNVLRVQLWIQSLWTFLKRIANA